MKAHSSQTRLVGKVDGQFLHARWWLGRPILDVHPLPHFGQMKVWDEDGRDAAHSFLLKREDPPFCIPFNELLSLEHKFLHRLDLIEVRKK